MLRSIRNVKLLKCVSLICLSPLFVFYSSLTANLVNVNLELLSLSKDVFERLTSTGSGLFSFLSGIFAQIFGQIVSIIKKETKKYKLGIVNLFQNEKDFTSG